MKNSRLPSQENSKNKSIILAATRCSEQCHRTLGFDLRQTLEDVDLIEHRLKYKNPAISENR